MTIANPRIAFGIWACSVLCGYGHLARATEQGVSPIVEIVALSQKHPKSVRVDGSCRAHPAAQVASVRSLAVHQNSVQFCDEQNQCDVRPEVELRCRDVLRLQAPETEPRQYGHRLRARVHQGELRLVATLHMESYVAGVVGAEIGAAPQAAQDAQAILVRTFAMGALSSQRHEDAPLCDLTHCQVYAGTITGAGWRAAKRTWGKYLVTPAGQPAPVFFHSTCGGSTISAHDAWPGGPETHIVPVSDLDEDGTPFCAESPYLDWSLELNPAQVSRVLTKLMGREVDADSAKLRPEDEEGLRFQIGDREGTRSIPGSKLLRAFGQEIGWYKMKSSRFRVTRLPEQFRFTGTGLGHRVGLCQFGAMRRAKAGAAAEDILGAYFPNLNLVSSTKP